MSYKHHQYILYLHQRMCDMIAVYTAMASQHLRKKERRKERNQLDKAKPDKYNTSNTL